MWIFGSSRGSLAVIFRMSATATTIPTPNPAERALKVAVLEESFASVGGVIPVQGTTYADSAFKTLLPADYRKNFGDFVYTGQGEKNTLLFAKGKTTEEANTPFRKTTWKGNHRWPPILVFVAVDPDYGNLRSFPSFSGTTIGTSFAPTYYVKTGYIPDVSEGTRFIKEEFFGPTQFNIPQSPVPVPSSVSFETPSGVSFSFPECLHPKIQIPDMITSLTSIIGGSAAGVGTSLRGTLFPATNFESWGPYVLSDIQTNQDGGWYRVRIRVVPPPTPDVIISQSNA